MTHCDVDAALSEVARSIRGRADREYFDTHHERYAYTLRRVTELLPKGSRILDIGSHYLHISAALRFLGYQVVALDVPEFQELSFVRERGLQFDIAAVEHRRLEDGQFLPEYESSFDLVVFCEILEHITFNPCDMWRGVHRLLKVGGIIFVTTPNSLQAMSLVSALYRAVRLDGLGIDVPSILHTVTYGHHWKEYSSKEIVQYFSTLSPDFLVQMRYFRWRTYSYSLRNPKDWMRRAIRFVGDKSGAMAQEIEAVVVLRDKSEFKIRAPDFG